MEGEQGVQSRRYLRDLFAPFGTSASPEDEGTTDEEFWEISDRGANFDWLEPTRRAALDTFAAWVS